MALKNVMVNLNGFLHDPIAFSDLREREEAERKSLEARYLLLRDLSARKRSLTTEEEAELQEIEAKLASNDVVDPLFKAVQQRLGLDVGDHIQGLLPSQQMLAAILELDAAAAGGAGKVDWMVLIEMAGLKNYDESKNLADSIKGLVKNPNTAKLLSGLVEVFDKYMAGQSSGPSKKKTPDIGTLAEGIEQIISPPMPIQSELARAVKRGLVYEAESLVDWLVTVFRSGVIKRGGRLRGDLTDSERLLAAVFGILSIDREEPPAWHLPSVKPPYDPSESRRKQLFGKALFAAQGEYNTNIALFEAVLPVLVKLGERGPQDHVKAIEWAGVVRYLLSRGYTEDEPQLGRRVDEALNSIQNVGDNLPPSMIGIDLPDLEEETIVDKLDAERIMSLQPTYFAAMFEELKVFAVLDKLVELFQNGILPIGKGEAGNNLFRYWKETATRVSEQERRSFYARSLGFVGGDDGGMPNREFSDLWMRFVSAVSSFIRQNNVDDLLRTSVPGAISQQQVRKAGRDLASNLSLHGYGMAYFMATELQKQIKDAIKILSDDDIKNAYGARDMWQVIDQVATLELGGARNSVRYRTMAASGAIIIAWLAKKSRELAMTSFGRILDIDEIRNPSPRPYGSKPTTDPNDSDLVNACDQWLAVTGTQEEQVEGYAQPRETPNMPSKPIQIPSIAREMLESVGVPAMSFGNGTKRY